MKQTYGAAGLRPPNGKKGRNKYQDFIICSTGNIAAACGTLVLVSFGPFFEPGGTAGAVVLLLVASCLLMFVGRQQPRTADVWVLLPLGAACAAAVVAGAALGLYCYGLYGYFSLIYSHSRVYENVVPSTSAGAVADAGRIVFEAGAKVDQSQAAAYGSAVGDRYCVAPIRGPAANQTSHVEFWAVGVNCCGWLGEFYCDDAADAHARGGVVVMDGPDWFGDSNHDHYTLARRKAEARFGIVTGGGDPVYVRWVTADNMNLMTVFYSWRAWIFIVIAAVLYVGLSEPILWAVCFKLTALTG